MASSEVVKMQEEDKPVSALKKKTEQVKKSELLREIHKLDVQIQALEREKCTHIFSKRSDFREDFKFLEEEEMKLTEDRKTEKIKIKQQLEKMSHMVKRFHCELRDVKPTPEFVEKLKMIMEEIEGVINSFKEQQFAKYEELMQLEKTLVVQLHQLEHKFESWNHLSKTEHKSFQAPKTFPVANAKEIIKDLPPEIAAFEKFVHQSGGHRGGWDEHDHQTFLRYRNMYKGRIVFLDHVKPLLPTRTETEIREHESWYQEYVFLNENKKYAIKKWREKKEEEKEDAISQVQEVLEAKKEQEVSDPQEKVERLKQINAWRILKELEKATKKEQKVKLELEKKKQEEEKRKKQLQTKKMVEEYRQHRQLEKDVLDMIDEDRKQEEAEKRKEVIAKEIGRFRKRDMQHFIDKLEKEKEKEEKKRQKEKQLEALKSQVQVDAPRDPNRLLQPTAGWKERLKDPGPSGGGQVLHMPHRAIPSWRQGIF